MDAAGAGRVTPKAVAERLRASGHRVTRQRLAVFEALAELGGHRGVVEIADRLHERGDPLPLTSVYNAVEVLETAGLVSVAHRGPPRARYELRGRGHEHFVCRACGAILDVEPLAQARCVPPLPDVIVEDVEVTYRGVCGTCAVHTRPPGQGGQMLASSGGAAPAAGTSLPTVPPSPAPPEIPIP